MQMNIFTPLNQPRSIWDVCRWFRKRTLGEEAAAQKSKSPHSSELSPGGIREPAVAWPKVTNGGFKGIWTQRVGSHAKHLTCVSQICFIIDMQDPKLSIFTFTHLLNLSSTVKHCNPQSEIRVLHKNAYNLMDAFPHTKTCYPIINRAYIFLGYRPYVFIWTSGTAWCCTALIQESIWSVM